MMRKAITGILILVLALALCGSALAVADQEQANGAADIGSGRGEFTNEELPEFGDTLIPEPATETGSTATLWQDATNTIGQGGAAVIVAAVVLVIVGVIVLLIRKRKRPIQSGADVDSAANEEEKCPAVYPNDEKNEAKPSADRAPDETE